MKEIKYKIYVGKVKVVKEDKVTTISEFSGDKNEVKQSVKDVLANIDKKEYSTVFTEFECKERKLELTVNELECIFNNKNYGDFIDEHLDEVEK